MRMILLVSLPALYACASTPEPEPPPMPSARATDLDDAGVPSTAQACLTRYTYRSLDLQIDCSTEHVGGDPHHWVMSCAIPADFSSLDLQGMAFPALHYEATTDERGALLQELIDQPPGVRFGYIPAHDAAYVYDGQHRLTEVVKHDVNGVEIYRLVVGPRNAGSNPLSIAMTVPPLAPLGVPFPATGQIAHVYGYDANGRLVTDHGTFADGVVFWDATIDYDDAALRRDSVTIVDTSNELHAGGGPGYNTTHEFLDASGRVLEVDYTRPDDPGPAVVDYRYDDQSRVSTMIATRPGGFASTVDYIYECP